jgi:MFS transporter, DHA3 family, macrolide efflux protein
VAILNDKQQKKGWALPFFTLWTGQAISILGSQTVQFALIWWITRTTGSATVLATASLVGLLPQVILSPLAGTLVDRWNRRITMMVSDSSVAAATVVLVYLFFSGSIELWHVYMLLFVRSAAGSFHWPAMQASTSLMVPKDKLSRIQGLNQTLNGGMNIASAPLGALLVELLPMHGIMSIDIGSAMLGVLILVFIKIPQPSTVSEETQVVKATVWQDFTSGLRYIWSWPGLVMILVMATFINLLLTPAFSLLPILVTRHFGGQAFELAWMQSSYSIGVVAGGLLLSLWGGFRKRILTTMIGLVGISLSTLAVGLMPSTAFVPALAGLLISGISNPITNGPLFAALQATVAPEMQGRVFTVLISAASAMTPIGLIVAGPVADRFGVQVWFIAGGILTLLLAIAGFFHPALMGFEEGPVVDKAKKGTQEKQVLQCGD